MYTITRIKCPNCGKTQYATIKYAKSYPFWGDYIHTCEKCKYTITESEWNEIGMQKIMFNDKYNLTNLVLERKKWQTRRFLSQREIAKYNKTGDLRFDLDEIVAIAQSYKDCCIRTETLEELYGNIYRGDKIIVPGWTNKMFVRAELMQHFIQIRGIRMEYLQDISDEDCIAEGVQTTETPDGTLYFTDASSQAYSTPQQAYAELINKISGRGTWESNPLVAVYDFVKVR